MFTRRLLQLLLLLIFLSQNAFGSLSIVRELPAQVRAGENLTVILKVSGRAEGGVVVREALPSGWEVVNASPSGYFSPNQSILKWVFPRVIPEEISYTLRVPAQAEGKYRINGSWLSLKGGGEIPASELTVGTEAGGTLLAAGAAALLSAFAALYILRRRWQ